MKVILSLSTFIFSLSAHAAYPVFSQDEIDTQKKTISTVTSAASACLEATWTEHVSFFEKWKVSKFYGNRKPEHKTLDLRKAALKKYGAPAHLITELEPISCIGLTLQCLGEGFAAAGQAAAWAKIHARLAENKDFLGTDLIFMLRQLGWKVVYWNPDPTKNLAWDKEDQTLSPLPPGKVWNAVWGGHAYRYATVMKKKNYVGIPVDDVEMLNGFGNVPPVAFTDKDFFVGIAHAGYHVFPGSKGKVIEAHSMRNLNAFDNLEVSEFNPLGPNGGPRWTRTEKYRSGLIAIPPAQ